MSTADHHEPAHSPQGTGATMGPETQMLNLKILQNLAQNNIYRDENPRQESEPSKSRSWDRAAATPP